MPPLKLGHLIVRRVLHSSCKVGKRAVELAGDDAVELAVEGVETMVQTGPQKLLHAFGSRATTKAAWGHISRTARGSESHDDAQPDAHHAAHPQPLVTRGAALPFIDALPGNEGVLVVQLPKQLPWQRAVVHAVDAQPGDVLHDGAVLAHVLLGGTACVPILCRLPLHPTSQQPPRIDRVCLAPGDEVVAGQPIAYMARADQPSIGADAPIASSSSTQSSSSPHITHPVADWRAPLQLLRQCSMSLFASLQRVSSQTSGGGGSVTSRTAPVYSHSVAAL